MSNWCGLDTGGVEQLWNDELIFDVLQIMQKHSPVRRYDLDSEFYEELSETYPDITWQNINRDGSRRPIFRKADPFAKLGLLPSGTESVEISQLGQDVLEGNLSLQEIYILTCKTFRERNGAASFVLMCRAAINLPNHVFTLEDVEYGVSKQKIFTPNVLTSAIERVRELNLQFPTNSRRRRVLRRFMNTLVSAGAMQKVSNGWVAGDDSIMAEIAAAKIPQLNDIASFLSQITKSKDFDVISPGSRETVTFNPDAFRKNDPEQRARLLERAHSSHEKIVEIAAKSIRDSGGTPLEDRKSFDVAMVDNGHLILEAKSITQKNTISQIRKSISQLPEYRWVHKNRFPTNTSLFVATSENPQPHVGEDYIDYLENDRNIKVLWLEGDRLIDRSRRDFRQTLGLLQKKDVAD